MLDILKGLLGIGTADVRSLAAREALTLAEKPDVALVDVREASEIHRTGKVKGALHIPRGDIARRADPRSATHDQAFSQAGQIILYCASGNRSSRAARTLKGLGFENVEHVAGGFVALKEAGAKIEGPP